MIAGSEIALRIDQTLTQDATGTMVYLELEAMGFPTTKTDLSVSYIDHNTLQTGFENADDHLFLQTAAARTGAWYSRAGNGICHQVHLYRFAVPGKTLLGADSHTPHAGGLGMLAFGAGGLDVAMAMAGKPFYVRMPEVINVKLEGKPGPWISAKDIILELLRRLSVSGGVGKIFEYSGSGLKYLSVQERATITNMGAELGATSSIFPSDQTTLEFLGSQNRSHDFRAMYADDGAEYDGTITVDLGTLEPLIALPHSPDNVRKVSDVAGQPIDQVFIGSCTNASYMDLCTAAKILEGKVISDKVSLVVSPGSRQILYMLSESGVLSSLVRSGARILECACGPCLGIGQAPKSKGVSLRTSNRNFEGRSGTPDAQVYLAGVETAAASALTGKITDPRTLRSGRIVVQSPDRYFLDDGMLVSPPEEPDEVTVIKGPNIKSIPKALPWQEDLDTTVLLKVGDNITTDHILPGDARILPLRSNIPAISRHCFERVDPDFVQRALSRGGGIIVGGLNYGQGSSREHAVLAPLYLGVKIVIAKSFARIHRQNLINFGILPLEFICEKDYELINLDDELRVSGLSASLESGIVEITNQTSGQTIKLRHGLSPRQITVLKAGGLLYCK